jgi:hypothetical protein
LETAAQINIKMAMIKTGHQNSPTRQSPTPIAIKHPLDFFGLIGCPQCGHFSADFDTSFLQAGQVIKLVMIYVIKLS